MAGGIIGRTRSRPGAGSAKAALAYGAMIAATAAITAVAGKAYVRNTGSYAGGIPAAADTEASAAGLGYGAAISATPAIGRVANEVNGLNAAAFAPFLSRWTIERRVIRGLTRGIGVLRVDVLAFCARTFLSRCTGVTTSTAVQDIFVQIDAAHTTTSLSRFAFRRGPASAQRADGPGLTSATALATIG